MFSKNRGEDRIEFSIQSSKFGEKEKKLVKAVVAVLFCISIITVGIFGTLRFFNKDTVSYAYGEYIFLWRVSQMFS